MKLSWRIWVLIFALSLALMSIVNLESAYIILVGLLVVSTAFTLTYFKTSTIKVLIFLLTIGLLLIIILSSFPEGVIVTSVQKDSQFFSEGFRKGMIINMIDGQQIKNVEDYSAWFSSIGSSNESRKIEFQTDKGQFIIYTNETEAITVSNIPKTKLKTGLDLSGGARAIVRPVNISVNQDEMDDLVSITSNRLNAFGISDVDVRSVSDLEGNRFLRVEVAGITPEDLKEIVGQQGKFEAKIGNETVFISGEKDITFVCRNDATCAGIESCQSVDSTQSFCTFRFSISLSEAAAQRHADITKNMAVNSTAQGNYLVEKLNLLLDDNIVDSLLISEDLKGRLATQIQISGSGTGVTQDEAYNDAVESMKKLQTILITGSLPYKLEIVKLDSTSPALGKEFTRNIIYLGVLVFVIISAFIFIKYRRANISLAVILTMFSEAIITLGIAAIISWNLDAPSIAGIIAGIGTGVNDQIVIIDESVSKGESSNIKLRIKRAFFIIIGAFFTIFASMLPLFWVGAGLLRGFALTTILGVSVGILITRPAFVEIMKKIEE